MNIEVFTITYNESKMLPFFLNYYSEFCKTINIYDNYSTDESDDIFSKFDKCRLNVFKYDTNNKLNDEVYLNIKNNCWKNSKCDYVIVVDCDEFLYPKNLSKILDVEMVGIPKPIGYDMWAEDFPNDDIVEEVKYGARSVNYDKLCIFNPNIVKDINYSLGCHHAYPVGYDNSLLPVLTVEDIKLLHYKNVSFEHRLGRHKQYNERLSDFNITTGSGIHYTYTEEMQLREFNELGQRSTKII